MLSIYFQISKLLMKKRQWSSWIKKKNIDSDTSG